MASPSLPPSMNSTFPSTAAGATPPAPQLALLDFFFPGFSMFAGAVQKYMGIDLNLYISIITFLGAFTVLWSYSSSYFWDKVETHFMSSVDIRTDDEIYNMVMTWIATQTFSQSARRFVVNADLSSRAWYLRRWDYDSDESDEDETSEAAEKKALSYTPSFGTHYFFYKGRLLLFKRNSKEQKTTFLSVSEREEISICCFGRNPWIIKKLLQEARLLYNKKDQAKTLIYRGSTRTGTTEPTWQRCLARNSRPFSTVILNEKVKTNLIDDVTDYLSTATQRWYSNRGIPYRRGYLLYGPPGTGKSSLSLALAGFFKMRIYIVSLSSSNSTEENLITLFSELPRRCVVLLEDIDTAGLTHTREDGKNGGSNGSDNAPEPLEPGQLTPGNGNTNKENNNSSPGRLSLSGLLNILDGVASQEGRVLIMTTNHVDKLDKALIRPGRVDMIVEFGRADADMTAAIFRAIFARLDADSEAPVVKPDEVLDEEILKKQAEEKALEKKQEDERVNALALEFAASIPTHEFSPAEIQGHLLKHKRDPRAAIDNAAEFVEQTRKDRKEKEIKDAEDRRKAEEKKLEEEAEKVKAEKKKLDDEAKKAKEEEEEQKRKVKKEERRRKKRDSKSKKSSDSDSNSSSSSDSDADDENAKSSKKKEKRSKRDSRKAGSDPSSSSDHKLENKPAVQVSANATESPVQPELRHTQTKHKKKDSGYGTPTSVEA